MRGPSLRPIIEKFNFLWGKSRVQAGPQRKPIYMLIVRKSLRKAVGEFTPLHDLSVVLLLLSLLMQFVEQEIARRPQLFKCQISMCNSEIIMSMSSVVF